MIIPRFIAGVIAAIFALGLASHAMAEDLRQLTWDDLLPIGEQEVLAELMQEHMTRIAGVREGSADDQMIQVGTFNVVHALDGESIRIPGFVIPFSFRRDSRYDEFLLVPYAGACIHVPPPPPNQIIYVQVDEPIEVPDIWSPVWAEGVLTTQKHEDELGDAAYTMRLTALEEYSR